MSDLRLELRFKNARLFNLIEERFRVQRGDRYGCCAMASERIGISSQVLNSYLTMRQSPWTWLQRNGHRRDHVAKERLKSSAQKIADFFCADPYELFPINLYRLKIPRLLTKTMDSERYLSFAEARQQHLLPAAVETNLDEAVGLREALEIVLKTLTPREGNVIKMRFGLKDGSEKTLEEVGRSFAITHERVRQIEAKALRKLRHPSRSRNLKAFIE